MVKSGLKRPSILTDDSTIDAKLQQIILCSKDFGDTKLAKWRSVDSMMELARQNDFKCRRMKNISLRSLVQKGFQFHKLMCSAIYWVRDNCLDDDVENDDDDDSMDEAPVPTLNLMNRALLKSYSQFGKDAVECASNNVDPMAIEKIAEGTPNPSLLPSSSPAIDLDKSAPPAVLVPVISASTAAVDKRAAKKPKQSYPPPTVRYSDLGGMDRAIEEIRELIEAPIAHPEIYRHLNISPPRGVLLHGPPGCGKTQLARAVAGELGVPFIQLSAPSIVSGMSGESEKKIREVFEEAASLAPCLLFFDEIDAITPKRETAQREMERRIVAQLLTCIDDLQNARGTVIVIGATNRPDALDEALRRAGRFDREISIGIPDEEARRAILSMLTANLRLSGDFDFNQLAKVTPGYVGADLRALTTAAGVLAVKRIFGELAVKSLTEQAEHVPGLDDISFPSLLTNFDSSPSPVTHVANGSKPLSHMSMSLFLKNHPSPLSPAELEPLSISMIDFQGALEKIQPSSKREGFATVPDVSWSDIGALTEIRDELRMAIVEPIKRPDLFKLVGITQPAGVLLWGPPGCGLDSHSPLNIRNNSGKTLLAKAVANESHCNFISVKGPELLNKYVGESERAVRQVFARARSSAPCVIFFDELDALCPRRGNSGSDSQTSERVVNQLLTELDGLEDRQNVFIIAATNRPDIIDRAMLRPGRLDKLLYVRLPNPQERFEILTTLAAKVPIHPSMDLKLLANDAKLERFSGADLFSLLREAGVSALRERMVADPIFHTQQESIFIEHRHFMKALNTLSPSVTVADLRSYESIFSKLMGGGHT